MFSARKPKKKRSATKLGSKFYFSKPLPDYLTPTLLRRKTALSFFTKHACTFLLAILIIPFKARCHQALHTLLPLKVMAKVPFRRGFHIPSEKGLPARPLKFYTYGWF